MKFTSGRLIPGRVKTSQNMCRLAPGGTPLRRAPVFRASSSSEEADDEDEDKEDVKGLYQASTWGIVVRYHEALKAVRFRPFAGANAKWQPPDVPSSVPRLPPRRLIMRMRMMCRPAPV